MPSTKKSAKKLIAAESHRLDWMISNSNAECGIGHNGKAYIRSWVCNGAPGNESGGSGRFLATGKTHRDCIDKFLAGDINPAD